MPMAIKLKITSIRRMAHPPNELVLPLGSFPHGRTHSAVSHQVSGSEIVGPVLRGLHFCDT